MGLFETNLKCDSCGCPLTFFSFNMSYFCPNAICPKKTPNTERCICGHPGDTPTCPIDHDQIQHEQE